MVRDYFNELDISSENQLRVLSERGLAAAVSNYVDKDDKDAMACIYEYVNINIYSIIKSLNEFFVKKLYLIGYFRMFQS